MTTISRTELLRTCSLVRPALAKADYIPALTHILFREGVATAYDDINAIGVTCGTTPDMENRCVPGEFLARFLGALSQPEVNISTDKTGALLVAAGRSKVKLPTLPGSDFTFSLPSNPMPEVTLAPDILAGIGNCLMAAGKDQAHPAQMGVTMEADAEGRAVLYSTDGVTISRAQTASTIELPGGVPVILPAFLCEQLPVIGAAFPGATPVLVLLSGALLVDFIEPSGGHTVASIFSKVLVDIEPVDFGRIVKRYCNPATVAKSTVAIPDALDAAFGRALLVLAQEPTKTTRINASKEGLELFSSSAMGDADDVVPYEGEPADFMIDPALVSRGLKRCAKMHLGKGVMILANGDGSFLHLIAHVSE